MSSLSLKEQLEALSLNVPSASNKQENKSDKQPKKSNQSGKDTAKQKPTWLEHAQYGVELLKAYFPHCFKEIKEIQPLKVGIKQDLVKLLSTRNDIVIGDKGCMVSSLAYYVNSPAYHKTVTAGAVRIDLEGQPAGIVTTEEAQYSINCRKAKLEKKIEKGKPSKPQSKATESV